jgi:hypothetical protein
MKEEINLSGNAIKNVQLNGKNAKEINKITNLMVDVIRRQRRLWRKEISDWQQARFALYRNDQPRTYPMQELYEDVMLDGHLTGITGNRTLRTTNKDFCIAVDGIKDEELSKYIEGKQWFETVIEEAHKSTYFGYSLLWIKEYNEGEIKDVMSIPRGLVIPQDKILLYQLDGIKGLDFSEINDILLYSQFYDHVGLLEKAAVYTILKRHSWGSWDEFEELFGIPIRIAKIASQSETVKNEVAGWLEEMGSSAYGVFPVGTEVEIKENSKTDAFNVFHQKIQALDRELSKLVLHQTMTTDNGSSKAQGSVHENTLNELIYADEKKMMAFLNDTLMPAMRKLGYNLPENARFMVEKTVDVQEQIKIDGVFMQNGYTLKQDYLERTYGVEIEQMPGQEQGVGKP